LIYHTEIHHLPKQILIHNLNKNDLIEDAFGWVDMMANQVQEQYIFVLKSGLDDWDIPLSSDDDEQQKPISPQKPVKPQNTKNLNTKRTNKSSPNKPKQTSLIFLKDGDGNNADNLEEEHEIVYTKSSVTDHDENDSDDE